MKQCNALSNSKITAYFQKTVTKEEEIPDSKIDSREVIEVD